MDLTLHTLFRPAGATPAPRAPTLSWAGTGSELGFLPLTLTFGVGVPSSSPAPSSFFSPTPSLGWKRLDRQQVQPLGTEAPSGVAAAPQKEKNFSRPKKERENVTIPEENAMTFGRGVDRGAPLPPDPHEYPSCLPPPRPHTSGCWGSPRRARPRQANVPNLVTLAPSPTFAMVGEGAHFSFFLFLLGGSGLEKPVFSWDPFLQSLTPPPLPQGSRHGAPLTSDPKARRGREGPGSVWAPPWLPKGRALQQQGLKSDGRRVSCGVGREAGAGRSAGAGGAAPPSRLAGLRGCQIQRCGGGQGVPPRPLPTRLRGAGDAETWVLPAPPLSNHFPRL